MPSFERWGRIGQTEESRWGGNVRKISSKLVTERYAVSEGVASKEDGKTRGLRS